MTNKLVPAIVLLAVTIIITGSVLSPIIDDAKDSAGESEINTLTNYLSPVEKADVAQFNAAVSAPSFCPLYLSDNFVLRNDLALIIFDGNLHTQAFTTITITHNADGTIAISGVSSGNTITYSVDSTYAFKADTNGSYTGTQIVGDSTIWLKSTSDFYAVGAADGKFASAHGDVGYINGVEGELTYATTEENGLLKLTASTVTGAVVSDGSSDVPCKYIVVPHKVTNAADSGIVSLYGAIPVIVIVAILAGAIAIILPRRY